MRSQTPLTRLIDPLSPEEFVAGHWSGRPLLIRRAARGYFDSIVSPQDVERVLASADLLIGDVREVRQSQSSATASLHVKGFGPATVEIDRQSIVDTFQSGGTIVLQGVERHLPALKSVCLEASRLLGGACWANAFLGRRNAESFAIHKDSHSVFALHLYGTKVWRLPSIVVIGEPDAYTTDLAASPDGIESDQALAVSVEVRAGDTLFIPRGTPHVATATSDRTMHVSLGVRPITWRSLVAAWLEDRESGSAWLDEGVFVPWLDTPGEIIAPDRWINALDQLGIDAEGSWTQYCQLLNEISGGIRAQMIDGFFRNAPGHANPAQRIRVKPFSLVTLKVCEHRAVLNTPTFRFSLNEALLPMLQEMINDSGVSVAALRQILDEDAVEELLSEFWRAGIIEVVAGDISQADAQEGVPC
jgi:Cupin superfamily protein